MLPKSIYSGEYKEGHVQGIAVDLEKGFVYYSFTTILLKTDLMGNPVGSVCRLAGHLGCITFNGDDGRVYGSLELKHDAIGAGIIRRTGWDPSAEDSFYLVRFECDKITKMNMDAESDGVMSSVYLPDIVRDYSDNDEVSGKKHRYGCSGFDGVGYGPVFGESDSSHKKLMVAYGIYSDTEREDNDYQVILQYDPSVFEKYGHPLRQESPHHNGPEAERRYFLFTGNTRYGVQNLEYDKYSGNWFAAVYRGAKEKYPNYPMFIIDGAAKPLRQPLTGRGGETGDCLTLLRTENSSDDGLIYGATFPYGQTGLFSVGDGSFYVSIPVKGENGHQAASVRRYVFTSRGKEMFEEME